MAIAAGKYEPVRAFFYQPVSTKTTAGEPNASLVQPTLICKRWIRFKTISGNEQYNNNKSISVTGLTIWVHKDSTTKKINTRCYILHRGIKYGIQAKVYLDYIQDEVGFKVCTDT